ncbi:hypothetical protein KL866_16995 [Alteromonas sp. ALT199]|uniref:hypothetical protein n=1 Tax=unclassified Alteromonas TaxID=2614992 RepID=UPI001BE9420E|nr:hypothetical protein [Alteromonas sp. ALT199]MBT3136761.1 hypothetical protein [Alteromonas sp. ALT199]
MIKWIGLWLCSLCVVFAAGYYASDKRPTLSSTTSVHVANVGEGKDEDVLQGAPPPQQGDNKRDQLPKDSASVPNNISLELWLSDKPKLSLKQIGAFIISISTMGEQAIIDSLSNVDTSIDDPDSAIILSSMVSRLVELNPQKAWDLVDNMIVNLDTKRQLRLSVIVNWANQAPFEVLDWYIDNASLTSGRLENSIYPVLIFREMASQDIDSAFQSIALVKSENLKSAAYSGIFSVLETPEQFRDTLSLVKRSDDKQLETDLISMWVRKDVESTKSWFDTLDDNEQIKEIKRAVFESYVNQSPSEAASWFVKHSSSESYQSDVEHAARTIAFFEPDTALNWAQRQTNIDTEQAVATLLQGAAYRSPEFVEENLDLLVDRDAKINLAHSVYSAYGYKSERRAEDFLNGFEYKNELAKRIKKVESSLKRTN